MTPKYWTLSLIALVFFSLSSEAYCQGNKKIGEKEGYEIVKLDPPAVLSTKPLVDGPLLRGQPMKFALEVDGAPRPINMWSGRIDYTTSTLTFISAENMGQDARAAIAVSDPYEMFPGWESRSIAGVSLNGWSSGEILHFTFEVSENAPESGSLRLGDHPFINEKLAHDDPEAFKIFEFLRMLDFSQTMDLPVEDVSDKHQPYKFATPAPKVLYQKKSE